MWKEFNSHRIFLYTNLAADSLFVHKYGHCDVMWKRSIATLSICDGNENGEKAVGLD